jgi:hypothetical protein
MWRIKDDQLVQQVGVVPRKRPRDDPAPVVPHDMSARMPRRPHNRGDVVDEVLEVIGPSFRRPVGLVIPAHIGRPH